MCEKINLRKLVSFNGFDYPTEEELVMLILGSGTKKNPIEKLARQIVKCLKSSKREKLAEKLMKIQGIGRNRSYAICAALELGTRLNNKPKAILSKPVDVVQYVKAYAIEKVEHFLCITVTGSREIVSINVVSIGAGNMAMVHPREIFQIPIKEQASAVIFCHNHPGGNPNPSASDIETTDTLVKAGEILGIAVLDHIIITKTDYFSFMQSGLLQS